jgi:hypothetical protein
MNNEEEGELASWVASFRSAAQADGHAILTAHLRRFDVQADPDLLLEGTIEFVSAIAAFATIDGRSVGNFLDSQKYDPSTANDATYAVTFDVCGRGFARVLADTRLQTLDLADLYGMPWDRFQRVGFTRFWVSRVDGVDLSVAELERLEQDITDDLLYDYGEDELDFWFDPDSYKGAMLVSVQDHVELDA